MTVLRGFEGRDRRESGTLRILNLEDSPLDTELVQAQLSEGGIDCELVRMHTRADFAAALEKGDFDLILADYSLPGFDGLSALEMVREICPKVPFILISGNLGEEVAIETLKRGATDYVLKHRLKRLVPAVERAMHEAEERRERERAEEALRRSEQQFRTLVEQIPAITYVQEPGEPSRTTYISPRIEDMMGYSPQEYMDDPNLWVRTTHPEDRERVIAEDRRTDESGEPFRMEYRKITCEGRVIWVRDEAVLVKTPEGRPLYWQGIFADVTERKRTERALRESEHRFRQLFEQSVDALFVHDEEGRLVDCNAQACQSLGYTREELLKLSVKDFATTLLSEEEKKAKRGDTLWERAVRGEPGKIVGFEENELRRKDGTNFPVEVGVSAIDYGGRRLIFASARDLTERKRAEEELRGSEERFRATFEQAAVGAAHVGLDGRWLRVNEKLCEIVGYRRDELLKKTFQDITHPDDLDADLGYTRQLLAGDIGTFSLEKRYFRKDGSVVWANLTVSLVRGLTGDPKYFIAVIEDIATRKRAEEALKHSEELYRNVIEQAAENIFIVDVQTKRILEANAVLHRSLGYAPEELKRLKLYDIVAHDRESINNNIRRTLAQKRYFIGERKYRRKDGSLVTVEVNVSTVSYGGKEAMCIVAHDVTERNRAEQELRQSLSVLLALREAGEVLGSTLKSEEIVTRLLEIMRGVAALTAAIISKKDEEGNLHVWRSVGLEALRPRVRFAPEAVSARQTSLERQEPRFLIMRRPGFADEESLGALYLPLKARDRVVGMLEAYGSESLAQGDTTEVLSSLTNQAASALENALLYEDLADRERALQDLVGKLLRAQEEERRRVAYEVHDELAQVASAAHQHLQAFAQRYSPGVEKGRRDLERILRLVRATVSDARRIIANLRPTTLDDLGLAATISLEIERLREEGYQVDYEDEFGNERLPSAVEIALFRITQEALTNIRKHARTQRVDLKLRRRNEDIYLEIRDYGRGFDLAATSLKSGPGERVGLAGMQERVGMLGGKLKIRSRPGAGTFVIATIPLSHAL